MTKKLSKIPLKTTLLSNLTAQFITLRSNSSRHNQMKWDQNNKIIKSQTLSSINRQLIPLKILSIVTLHSALFWFLENTTCFNRILLPAQSVYIPIVTFLSNFVGSFCFCVLSYWCLFVGTLGRDQWGFYWVIFLLLFFYIINWYKFPRE